MSQKAEAAAVTSIRGVRGWWILASLVLGLAAGAAAALLGDGLREPALRAAAMVGGLWLNALQMTVIPLIVALLVTGIAQGAEALRAGRVAARSVMWFVIACTASAVFGMLTMPFLLGKFPLPDDAIQALQTGLAALDPGAAAVAAPTVADFFRGIIPSNVVAAASDGQILQLVVFTLVFAMAITRIDAQRRRHLLSFFEAIRDALLVVIGWVLLVAPLGVFALAFAVGASAGGEAFAAVVHYIVLVSTVGIGVGLGGYAIAIFAGRIRPGAFARAMIGPQTVAISTQSSLASLPAMLAAANMLGIRERVADVTLPLAVALCRATGPAMNLAVAFYVAHWLGIEPTMTQIVAATAVAAVVSYGSVSLPGQISFLTSITPIALALGVPVAPLALLVAVENIPDIFRTLGNVTIDVAVTAAVDHGEGDAEGLPKLNAR
jgi:Na+/H+-dicarboxylate symporter